MEIGTKKLGVNCSVSECLSDVIRASQPYQWTFAFQLLYKSVGQHNLQVSCFIFRDKIKLIIDNQGGGNRIFLLFKRLATLKIVQQCSRTEIVAFLRTLTSSFFLAR